MKNSISKVALLLLCSAFAFSSCTKKDKDKDDAAEKKTVTMQYRIMVNSAIDYHAGLTNGGLEELYTYSKNVMHSVSDALDKDTWKITETAGTEEEAIAACDKKAIAVFDEKLAAMNEAAATVKAKLDAKKAELLPKIALESSKAHLIYKDYGGMLLKGKEDILFPNIILKQGTTISFQAIGGENKANSFR